MKIAANSDFFRHVRKHSENTKKGQIMVRPQVGACSAWNTAHRSAEMAATIRYRAVSRRLKMTNTGHIIKVSTSGAITTSITNIVAGGKSNFGDSTGETN